MSHPALTIIRDEHGALSAMLRSLSMLLAEHRRHGSLPDFSVLRAMLFYVDEFPEQLHHTKESELLFPKLRARCPEIAPVLDRLDRDHARGEKAIRDLEHDLLAFEVLGEPRRAAFEQAVERYIDFYLDHMRVEEEEVLPLAREAPHRRGLGRARRRLPRQPRPAHRPRADRPVPAAVHQDRAARARADRAGAGAELRAAPACR